MTSQENITNKIIIKNFTIMKKYLFLISVVAVTMTACTSETEEYVGSEQSHEISFSPIAQKPTRAAVDGTTFPNQAMYVTAYNVTTQTVFFEATTFSRSSSTWIGGKYWPLSAAYINFLAYTGFEGTSATWGSNKADQVTLVMTDNKTAQQDLMYAIGNGEVTQSGNSLNFPPSVPMAFKHAQAWISFNANATSGTDGKITLNSITLNGAKYNGTYTITHTAYNANTGQSVAGAWTSLGSTANVTVPGWTAAAIAYFSSSNGVAVGDGLMIVPDDNPSTADFTSFTVNYTLDNKTYDYTYTPATDVDKNVDQAKRYIYNITFGIKEIEISPTITTWDSQTGIGVTIQ